jgi:ABC-2 type transport system permease protein
MFYREMIKNLVIRDFKVKYQRSFLGLFWTLLNPLLLFGIYIIVFSQVVRLGVSNYWVFLLSGLLAWNFFAKSLETASNAITYNADLTTKIYFPQEVLVISSAFSKLIEFGLELLILLGFLFFFYHKISFISLIFIPLIVLIHYFLILGLAFPLSCLMVFYKDMDHILSVLLTGWFFLTPVFYPDSLIPSEFSFYFRLNPMYGIIYLYRSVLYQATLPNWDQFLLCGVVSIIFFLGGYYLFNRYKGFFAEIV